jgi:hypothetical protein
MRRLSPGRQRLLSLISSRADLAEEFADLAAKLTALCLQQLGGLLDVIGRRSRGVCIGFDAGDVVGDVLGALRGILRAAGDFLGRGDDVTQDARHRQSNVAGKRPQASGHLEGKG